jgi:hypothetical protein
MMSHGRRDRRLCNSVGLEIDVYRRGDVLENNTRCCMKKKEKKDKTVGGQVLLYI